MLWPYINIKTYMTCSVLTGVCQGEASLVHAREGGSAELSCSLNPTSKEGASPNLFPLHVVEWVRLGYNVPVLIKFGVYAPRVHPNYKGKFRRVQPHISFAQLSVCATFPFLALELIDFFFLLKYFSIDSGAAFIATCF